MLVQFRGSLVFRHFPKFKKSYPFYPFLILKFIFFSCLFWEIRLKLRQGLNFCKDRKRIKTITFEDVLFVIFPLVENPFKMNISTFKIFKGSNIFISKNVILKSNVMLEKIFKNRLKVF